MKATAKLVSGLIVAAIGFAASTTVMADHYDRHHRHGHHQKHWKHDHRGHGHFTRERVVRERVVVQRPVYVERHVQYAPAYPRDPAIVLSVQLPPLVFPLH